MRRQQVHIGAAAIAHFAPHPRRPTCAWRKGLTFFTVLRQMIFWASDTPAKSVLCCNDRSLTAHLLRSGRGRETFTGLHWPSRRIEVTASPIAAARGVATLRAQFSHPNASRLAICQVPRLRHGFALSPYMRGRAETELTGQFKEYVRASNHIT